MHPFQKFMWFSLAFLLVLGLEYLVTHYQAWIRQGPELQVQSDVPSEDPFKVLEKRCQSKKGSEACRALAKAYAQKGEWAMSREILRQNCLNGHLQSCMDLAQALDQESKAKEFWEHACDLGQGEACYRFYEIRVREEGDGSDPMILSYPLIQSCALEYWKACDLLGTLLDERKISLPHESDGAKYHQMACDGGYEPACKH